MINPSFASVEDLNFGRMAFLGMNSEIEQMQADQKAIKEEQEALAREKDVGDEEMAKRFGQMKKPVTTATPPAAVPSKLLSDEDTEALLKQGRNLLQKVKKGKEWKNKKKQFIKPEDY